MKKLLCLVLALVMAFGAAAFAENAQGDPLEAILSGMSLRDKVAQMMIASFRVWQEVPPEGEDMPEEEPPKENITRLNDEIRDMVSRNHFGGILLFGENFVDAEQTLRLIADYQAANRAGGGLPQIVVTDQEGGNVNRIPYGTQGLGNIALGATGDTENARATAAIFGEELSLLGIQADFAPVVDVNDNALNPIIGIRSFSDDPQTVAAFGNAYIQGLHDAGIISTAKHFPGHGNTDTDSHTGAPVIDRTYEELRECELIPFQAAVDAGCDMIMTAHIQYPQIETGTYTSISTGESINLPATMSKTILTGILRGDMGFDGVVVTDALDMSAIADHFAVEDTIRLTIDAGVDLLILPPVKDTNLFQLTQTYVDTAVKLVERGEIDEARIDESVLRILKLKQKYGILDLTDFAVTEEKIAAAQAGVGSAAHREAEWQMAEKALTVYKNENGAFPLDVKAGEKTLILFADSCASRAGAGDLARQMLEERQALSEDAEIAVMVSTKDNEEACIQAAVDADHVILVHRVYNLACLDPATDDGFSSGTFDKIIPAVHGAGKTVIVLSCQLPYDATRFPDADAVLLTWWGSTMRGFPAEGASWSANLPAGLLACFGECPAEGVAPVHIPALDDRYMPALPATGATTAQTAVPEIETGIVGIQKYGNLELGISASTLLGMGYEYGDLLTVTVNGQVMEMPLGSSYSDVDNQQLICRAVNDGSKDEGKIILAINMGDLATSLGIAEKVTTEEEPGFRWDYKAGMPSAVTISLKEKGGYANEYMLHQLVRSNNREDYPSLTDEQYANFRNVATTGMGAWALFRSSSPVNPELNRNVEADAALNNAGICTVINLADSEETMKGYEGYANTFYSQRDVIALNLSVDFFDEGFKAGLAEGFRFMAAHEGPYLVHCKEGKERAGITSAILECLMGATAEEVVADYMVTYYNYYGVEPGTEKYDAIRQGNIEKTLAGLFGLEDIYRADLAKGAESFLLSIGLDENTIAVLKNNLGRSYD